MTNTLNQYLPLGELLERLRVEGFSVSPAQYGRVFRVAEAVFSDGLSPETNAADLQTLSELIGPIVCCTDAEQERFGAIFNSVMAGQLTQPEPLEPIDHEPVDLISPKPGRSFGLIEALIIGVLALALGVLIYRESKPVPVPPTPPVLPCSFGVGVKSIQGNTVTFMNRNPCPVPQTYEWDFGDGTPPLSTSLTTVRHEFQNGTGKTELGRVTLRGNCCPEKSSTTPTSSTYNPAPLPFLRLPETSRYTLANWVPLLLLGLGGLLGGGWWWLRRRRQRAQAAQRPSGGPFFLSFPQQDDSIQPSPSLVSWAHQLQQREESERHVLAIGPTIRRTIRNGGMPSVQFEAIKRRPRYLILIDDRSAYDQQAKLYAYVMGVLITRSVEMDVFFFHSDPRYLWNENYPKGLPISDLFRLYSSHYLVLVTEGTRLLDYDTGEVAGWAAEALSGWTSRALLTPVYPANWHYLEAALSRFFILLPATPDGQFLLRDYLGQPDNTPSFEELLRQFKVMPGTPNRGIFSQNPAKLTIDEVRTFLNGQIQGTDQTELVREWLFSWACATAVFPTPDWAMTLAIGRALETHFKVEGLVTSTNILKLTALPWLRQDSIPEPLRANLLAELSPDVEAVARQTVVDMLNDLQLSPGSVAYEEQQLRFWEQEYHLNNKKLGELSTYRQYPDLVKDQGIQRRLARQDTIENKYQPAGLLVLLLLPLLLYLTPARTQVAGFLLPFFRLDATATDSAAFYNNRAVASFQEATPSSLEPYGTGILDLTRSVAYRPTFEAVHNLNTSRYNLAVLERTQRLGNGYAATEVAKTVQQLLSPFGEVPTLMKPFSLFQIDWIPDSTVTRQYLLLLVNKANNETIYQFVNQANVTSVNEGNSKEVGVNYAVNQAQFNALVDKAKALFVSPGTREFEKDSLPVAKAVLNRSLLAFKPSTAQRDSLISLEAARIVLYFDGPRESKTIHVEAIEKRATSTAVESSGRNTKPTPPTRPQPIRKQKVKPRPVPRINVPTQANTNRLPSASSPEQPSTANQPVPQTGLPATVGTDNNPPQPVQQQQQPVQQQQQQQQPVQQQPQQSLPNETDLQQVYEQGTKCPPNSSFFVALPNRDKLPISAGTITALSDSPNLYEVLFYCDSYPQTIYSKRGFSHVKVMNDPKGGLRVVFYQNRPKVLKK